VPALSAAHVAFGDTVRAAREAHSWSQEELAGKAGLHRNQVGYLERAERNAPLSAILGLAAALGLTAAELMQPAEDAFRDGNVAQER
jgi:transcriptional regulator with XRE-family HTH domain